MMIKLTFKHLLVVSMILTLFIGLSLVSATDVTDDSAVSTKNICTHSITSDNNNDNVDVNDINNYVKDTFTSTSANNGSNSDENINGNTVGDSNGGSISELKDKIDTGGSSIILDTDYTYNADTDSSFTNGIVVSRDLTIDGQGHTIDLGGKIRFLQSTTSGITLVLKNLNIRNGKGSNGGAININGGSISFINSTFTGNNASSSGGAVYIQNGNGSFINSTFTKNKSLALYGSYGGAIYIKGNCSFINSTFTGNNASSRGGAVYIGNGNWCIINSTFTGNNASYCGAVCIENGNGSFINSTFTGNNATGLGGAVFIAKGNGSFINSTFTDNYGKNTGGAVYIQNSNWCIINSTFTNNMLYYGSGGVAVYFYDGNFSVINSTFTNNTAISTDSAIYIDLNSNGNKGSVVNCIFTGNNAYNGGAVSIRGYSSVDINNSIFIGNNATNAAVYIYDGGNGSFINSTFKDNNGVMGGAVHISSGRGSFVNCIFTGNNANLYGGAYGYGGAFYIDSTCNIVNSSFANNSAHKGGAIYINSNGRGNFTDILFINNTANIIGGVAYILGNGTFINSTFTGNNATSSASAILINDTNTTFVNITESKILDNDFGNIVFVNNISCINVDDTTKALSDPDLITKYTEMCVYQLGTYVYGSDGVLCYVNCVDETPVSGIAYFVIGNKTYEGFINNSKGLIRLKGVDVGNYTVSVIFNGSDTFAKYRNPFEQFNFTVNKALTNISSEYASFIINYDGLYQVVVDSDNNQVAGVPVILSVDGKIIATGITDEDGIALFNISVAQLRELGAGTYNALVSFAGDGNYEPSEANIIMTIQKEATKIIAKNTAFIINYNDLYQIIVNNQTAGIPVNLLVDGKIIATGITDEDGIALFNISVAQLRELGAGTYNALVSFAGDGNYEPSEANITLNIKKEASNMINVKAVKKSKNRNKIIQLYSTLKDSKNKAIKNQWIYFKVNNKKIYKVKTDSKGLAKLILNKADIKSCKINKKGVYRFTVSYKGSDNYKSNNKKGLIKVFKDLY